MTRRRTSVTGSDDGGRVAPGSGDRGERDPENTAPRSDEDRLCRERADGDRPGVDLKRRVGGDRCPGVAGIRRAEEAAIRRGVESRRRRPSDPQGPDGDRVAEIIRETPVDRIPVRAPVNGLEDAGSEEWSCLEQG